MASEDPVVAIARMDGRLAGIETQLGKIEDRMATKEGSTNLATSVADLRDALALERTERITGIEKVATRLQVVEDRMEQRKYLLGSGIALGVLGIIFGLFGDAITRAIGG